jgi:outer membrane lipoprotein-sorting protein
MNRKCDKIRDLIADSVTGTLSPDQARQLDEHLSGCSDCRNYADALKHEDVLLTQLVAGLDTDMRNRQRRLLETLDRCQPEQRETITKWRIIMKSRIVRLAAAAVILIAALVGIYNIGGSSVALADVLAKVEQARAFMYKMNMQMKMGGIMGPNTPPMDMDMEMSVLISKDFGMRAETVSSGRNTGVKSKSIVYIVPDKRTVTTLMPDQKKYMEMEFDDDWLAKMKQQNNDPRQMIKQMIGSEYTELGRSVIDGVKVDGFQTTDPAVIGGVGENVTLTLWVDVKRWLPVRSEMDFKMGDQMQVHGVVSEFKWDLPVAAEDFKPVIPDDFTSMEGFQMPKISEEGLIEGLRLFAELSGSYPKKLSIMELAQETMAFMTNKDVLEKIKEKILQFRGLDENELDELDRDEVMTKSMQITQPLQSPGFFYMMLTQEKKEPVYYGESVGPDDPEAVLMRWKASDTEYRVIFGDLSAGTVTREQLAELEKQPLK